MTTSQRVTDYGRRVRESLLAAWRSPQQPWSELMMHRPITSPVVAYLLVAALYVAGRFLQATIAAVQYLIDRGGGGPITPGVSPDTFERNFWASLTMIVSSVVILALFLGLMKIRPKQVLTPVPARTVATYTMIYVFLALFGAVAMVPLAAVFNFEPAFPHPVLEGSWALPATILGCIEAGFAEEIFLVIIPMIVLRSAGQRWWVIGLVLVAARLSFHVYYGWPSLGLLTWAAGALLFFYFTRCGLALILGHALRNLLAVPGLVLGDLAGEVTFVALCVIALALLMLPPAGAREASTGQAHHERTLRWHTKRC